MVAIPLAGGEAAAGPLHFTTNSNLGAFVAIGALDPLPIELPQDGIFTLPLTSFGGNFIFQGPITIGQNGGVGFGKLWLPELDPNNAPIPSAAAFGGGQAALLLWDDIDDKGGDV